MFRHSSGNRSGLSDIYGGWDDLVQSSGQTARRRTDDNRNRAKEETETKSEEEKEKRKIVVRAKDRRRLSVRGGCNA